MSYILEAIKKADNKRKLGAVPDLHSDHDQDIVEDSKRALWPYLIAVLLFCNAGLIAWWVGPWHEKAGVETSEIENIPESKVKAVLESQEKPAADLAVKDDQIANKQDSTGKIEPQTSPPQSVSITKRSGRVAVRREGGVDQGQADIDVTSENTDNLISRGEGVVEGKSTVVEEDITEDGSGAPPSEIVAEKVKSSETLGEVAGPISSPGGTRETPNENVNAEQHINEGSVTEKVDESEGREIAANEDIVDSGLSVEDEASEDFAETDSEQEEVVEKVKVKTFKLENVPYIYQLPASIQGKLPEIKISFHSYTYRPATRLVRINGHIKREGQELGKGITLERIVPKGVVLKFENSLFRLDV